MNVWCTELDQGVTNLTRCMGLCGVQEVHVDKEQHVHVLIVMYCDVMHHTVPYYVYCITYVSVVDVLKLQWLTYQIDALYT